MLWLYCTLITCGLTRYGDNNTFPNYYTYSIDEGYSTSEYGYGSTYSTYNGTNIYIHISGNKYAYAYESDATKWYEGYIIENGDDYSYVCGSCAADENYILTTCQKITSDESTYFYAYTTIPDFKTWIYEDMDSQMNMVIYGNGYFVMWRSTDVGETYLCILKSDSMTSMYKQDASATMGINIIYDNETFVMSGTVIIDYDGAVVSPFIAYSYNNPFDWIYVKNTAPNYYGGFDVVVVGTNITCMYANLLGDNRNEYFMFTYDIATKLRYLASYSSSMSPTTFLGHFDDKYFTIMYNDTSEYLCYLDNPFAHGSDVEWSVFHANYAAQPLPLSSNNGDCLIISGMSDSSATISALSLNKHQKSNEIIHKNISSRLSLSRLSLSRLSLSRLSLSRLSMATIQSSSSQPFILVSTRSKAELIVDAIGDAIGETLTTTAIVLMSVLIPLGVALIAATVVYFWCCRPLTFLCCGCCAHCRGPIV